jgi:thiol-disulfide isomerase/thioredoxin
MGTSVVKSVVLLMSLIMSSLTVALDVGDKAPQIIGRNLDGSLFALSRMEAKPQVLNFFWVECKPCKEEIPLLAKKEGMYPNVEFAVIHAAANPETDTNYDIQDIQRFSESLNAFPRNLVLGSDRLRQQYGITGYPYSVLLSADNKVEQVLNGFNSSTVQKLEAWFAKQK